MAHETTPSQTASQPCQTPNAEKKGDASKRPQPEDGALVPYEAGQSRPPPPPSAASKQAPSHEGQKATSVGSHSKRQVGAPDPKAGADADKQVAQMKKDYARLQEEHRKDGKTIKVLTKERDGALDRVKELEAKEERVAERRERRLTHAFVRKSRR